jgi:hypothetical protein
MFRLLLMALLPQIGGMLLMVARTRLQESACGEHARPRLNGRG